MLRKNYRALLQCFVFAVVCLSANYLVRSAQAADSDRPNIIWLMADDLGYGDVGCYGQKVIATPNIDQMAREGLRFTQFYSGATVCAPSRSVLMTGLHHGHTRVRGNAGAGNPAAQALRADDFTVAKFLQQAGYRTALVGKWGLGDDGQASTGLPRKQGFDEFVGYLNQRHAHNHFPSFLWRNEEKFPLPNVPELEEPDGSGYPKKAVQFADDLLTEEALAFVERNREQPFFLYWTPVIPHANNERARDLGNGAQVPDFGPYEKETWPEQDKGQAAMIHRLDTYVGRMLAKLKQLKLDQKTLFIFTSDNGPHNEARHNLERFQPSGSWTGIKRSLHDGGIRVPMICWWPGTIAPQQVSEHVGYSGDFFATAAELASRPAPAGLDSISFASTLRGDSSKQPKHEFLYWEFHENGFSQATLCEGRYKGIRLRDPDAPIAVYDLQTDPQERVDIAATNPALAARLDHYLKSARTTNEDWPARKPAAGNQGAKGKKSKTP